MCSHRQIYVTGTTLRFPTIDEIEFKTSHTLRGDMFTLRKVNGDFNYYRNGFPICFDEVPIMAIARLEQSARESGWGRPTDELFK